MGLIKQSLSGFVVFGLIVGCSAKRVGADTHKWSVTAQNGDKAVGCLAEDVAANLPGYIDLESLPNFNITTFKSLGVNLEESRKTGKPRSGLVDMSKGGGVGTWNAEDYVRHCDAYPPPEGTTEWFFIQQTEKLAVRYRLFSLGEKMVFIDARTREDKPKKPWIPNVHKD